MNEKKYYMVEFTLYNYEFEILENFFFKDSGSAKQYVTKYLNYHECRGITIEWDITELTFDELKEEITVADFEKLFDTVIVDDF